MGTAIFGVWGDQMGRIFDVLGEPDLVAKRRWVYVAIDCSEPQVRQQMMLANILIWQERIAPCSNLRPVTAMSDRNLNSGNEEMS